MTIKEISIKELKAYENNPRINDGAVDAVAASIKEFGFKVPIVVDVNNVIVAGHTRTRAAEKLGLDKVPCIVADDLTPEQINAFRLADNKTAELAEWDFEKLEAELAGLSEIDMSQFGFDLDEFTDEPENPYDIPNSEKGSLNDAFIVPPFSILDGRAGYWLERKREWKERIIDNGKSRERAKAITTGNLTNINETSLFDPVLCEIMYLWFCPENGKIIDPFAGGTPRGIVAHFLGREYHGNDLREEQIEENYATAKKVIPDNLPYWTSGDSKNIKEIVGAEKCFDMFFTCPPYADLEVYSDLQEDISNMPYDEFINAYEEILTNSLDLVKENRFAAIVVGDVRDKNGFYRNFVGDTKNIFIKNGFLLYNEIILIDPVGTAAIRAANAMRTRKVVKTHQNVLVFYKGDPQRIKDNFKILEYNENDFDFVTEE